MIQNNWFVIANGFVELDGPWAKVWFIVFNVLVAIILINIFVGILIEMLDSIREDDGDDSTGFTAVAKYMEERLSETNTLSGKPWSACWETYYKLSGLEVIGIDFRLYQSATVKQHSDRDVSHLGDHLPEGHSEEISSPTPDCHNMQALIGAEASRKAPGTGSGLDISEIAAPLLLESPVPMCGCNRHGVICIANTAFETAFCYPAVVGCPAQLVLGPESPVEWHGHTKGQFHWDYVVNTSTSSTTSWIVNYHPTTCQRSSKIQSATTQEHVVTVFWFSVQIKPDGIVRL